MRQLLSKDAAIILETRANVSRITRQFTFQELAKEWGMSRQTLFRYISPEYRELSQRIALKNWYESQIDRTRCFKCKNTLKGHSRCPYCTILVHEKKCDCEERLHIIQSAIFKTEFQTDFL